MVYIDDIIIATSDLDEHLRVLRQVLQALRDSRLYINLQKTQWMRTKVKYLGSYVSEGKIEPDPAKLHGIWAASPPRSKDGVRSFLGAAGYLRHHIPFFAEQAEPLTRLLKKKVVFEWTAKEQAAFNSLKQSMATAFALEIPEPGKPFVIFTVASETGVGAVKSELTATECYTSPQSPLERQSVSGALANEKPLQWYGRVKPLRDTSRESQPRCTRTTRIWVSRHPTLVARSFGGQCDSKSSLSESSTSVVNTMFLLTGCHDLSLVRKF